MKYSLGQLGRALGRGGASSGGWNYFNKKIFIKIYYLPLCMKSGSKKGYTIYKKLALFVCLQTWFKALGREVGVENGRAVRFGLCVTFSVLKSIFLLRCTQIMSAYVVVAVVGRVVVVVLKIFNLI